MAEGGRIRKRKFAFLLLEDSESEDEYGIPSEYIVALTAKSKKYNRHRQRGYVQNVVTAFRLEEYKTFFRVDRISVQYLQEKICQISRDQGISGIVDRQGTGGTEQKPLHERLLMYLWYMASLDKYASIADRFGTSESTASYAIRNLIAFIHDHLLERIIMWPTAAEQREMQDMFYELNQFPGVVGMIDGTHIKIRKPSIRDIDYYNRKDFYSVALQGIVGEDMRFIDVYTGWPGKVHDATVFRHSPIFQNGQALCRNGHLLGDSAYPNLPWLLTPFRDNGHLSSSQRLYNKVHSSIRSTVERAFGLLKGRFPRLQNLDQRDTEMIVKTILTGCVLHNICIFNNDTFYDILEEVAVPQALPNVNNFDANA